MIFLMSENETLKKALKFINENSKGIVFLEDKKGKVVASLSDGDIRRSLLKTNNLETLVSDAANYNFTFINENEIMKTQEIMKEKKIPCLPVLDNKNKLVSIIFDNNKIEIVNHKNKKINIPVVIMAGGKGARLKPYSNIFPKPLFPLSDSTITEKIIEKFKNFGCNNFLMIINHKKELIKAYFYKIKKECNLKFIDENKPLKTGGGLSLIKDRIKTTFFVTNCDTIVDGNYEKFYNIHKTQKNIITLVCAKKRIVLSYGIVEINKDKSIKSLKEKPEMFFLTNTGLYIVEPDFLNLINKEEAIDITEIIKKCIKKNKKVGVIEISENLWHDMGRPKELEKMINFFE